MIKNQRACKNCEKVKDLFAYVGSRSICRICWKYLDSEKKRDNLVSSVRLTYLQSLHQRPELNAPKSVYPTHTA